MATGIEERLQVLGIALPDPPSPGGNYDSPKIINGASYMLVEILDDAGRPLRAAVGVCALPKNALVEVQVAVEV